MDVAYAARLNSFDPIHDWTEDFWQAQGNPEQLEYLLQNAPPMDGIPADVEDLDSGWSRKPMVHSVCDGRSGVIGAQIVKLLIQYGSQQWNRMHQGYHSLHLASINGNEECVRCLVDAGADYMVLDDGGYLPFHSAVFGGSVSLMRYWLQLIPNAMSYPLPRSPTIFHWVCEGRENCEGMMRLLVSHSGISPCTWVNIPQEDGRTPLMVASKNGGPTLVRLLLEYGADADAWVRADPHLNVYSVPVINLILSCSTTVVSGLSENTRAALRAKVYATPLLPRLLREIF